METEMETETPSFKRDRPTEAVAPSNKKKGPISSEEEAKLSRVMAAATAASKGAAVEPVDQMQLDRLALQAIQFRETWNNLWSGGFGDFEDTTKIPPMRYTDNPVPLSVACQRCTVQVFSVKVTGLRGGLQWPLHVFGIAAVRDAIDKNRNVIFHRERDNCQILTEEDPYLTLTGPTRAVVMLRPVSFEAELAVKGADESEDKCLSSLAVSLGQGTSLRSCLLVRADTSKLSTLEFTHALIPFSVEATINVRVIEGSWNGHRCEFFARTASIDKQILLLDSGDEEVSVSGNGRINLSRNVVSVEGGEELEVSVKAWHGDNFFLRKQKKFIALDAGRSRRELDTGFCKMEVMVAWSLMSTQLPTENSF